MKIKTIQHLLNKLYQINDKTWRYKLSKIIRKNLKELLTQPSNLKYCKTFYSSWYFLLSGGIFHIKHNLLHKKSNILISLKVLVFRSGK